MNFKKVFLNLSMLLMTSVAFSHYLWVETAESGKLGKQHTVKVFFGEYTYGAIEDPIGEHFENVKNFKLWVVTPSGEKQGIKTAPNGNTFEGSFTPQEKGTYTVVLNNDEIDVIDYTKYDFGIFKTHYHSTAKVVVGNEIGETARTNDTGLAVVNISGSKVAEGNEVTLKVLFKGEPIADQEVSVFVADQWSKKLTTDEEGLVKFSLPWSTKYTVETTKKEEVPGTYKGEDYEFVWHCATYAFPLGLL